jgi:excisionase family DNA binding protein
MKKYLTPKEVAEILMVSPITLRQWAQKGMLSFKITAGGHRRYVAEDVEAFKEKYKLDEHAAAGAAPRILIVDDDDGVREMLGTMIHEDLEDAEIDTAIDGFDAGSKIQTFRPDIVLLDLMMPGLNGIEVCKRLKADERTEDIRVIAMTGYPSEENVREIMNAGAECCLSKPFERNMLKEILLMAGVESQQPG